MKVKLHSDIEGGRTGDEIDVSDERGRWLLERGYASSGERTDLSAQGPDYPYDELEERGGEGNEGAAKRLEGQEGREEWTAPDPEPVQAAGNVPGIDSKEGDAQGADVTQLNAPVDPAREDVLAGNGGGEGGQEGGGGEAARGGGGEGGQGDGGEGGPVAQESPVDGDQGGGGEGGQEGGAQAGSAQESGEGGEVTTDEPIGDEPSRKGKKKG